MGIRSKTNAFSVQDTRRTPATSIQYSNESPERPRLDKIYLGIVKDNRDFHRMGRLRVYIPELSGSPDDESKWFTVRYCSPFAGATNPLYSTVDGSDYKHVQLSYGFWMVPPDLENVVVVAFINGEANNGIWFGCLYQENLNHMVPGLAAGKAPQPGAILSDGTEVDPPVGEYSKRVSSSSLDPENPTRVIFEPLHENLAESGLYSDPERGPTKAGARREAPSQVYGFITPRGHHIYIDDGEIEIDESGQPILEGNQAVRKSGTAEYIRFRTRSGAQIIINDTTGYIYMNPPKGRCWLELSDDGGIALFTRSPLAIRSENTVNIHTDADVLVNAKSDIAFRSESNIFFEADGDIHVISKGNFNLLSQKNLNMHSNKDLKVSTDGELTVKADGIIALKGKEIHLNSFDVPKAAKPKKVPQADHTDIAPNGTTQTAKSIVKTLVTHEPFFKHPKMKASPPVNNDQVLNQMKGNGGVVLNEESFSGSLPEEDVETGERVEIENIDCIDMVSAEFESSGKLDAIAYDPGPGGWSYGSYQISAGIGTMDSYMSYLKKYYPDIYERLQSAGGEPAARAGSQEFRDEWKKLAKEMPTEFRKSQKDFIVQSHLLPVERYLNGVGIDMSQRSTTLRSVLYSTSVQHGPNGAKRIVERALSRIPDPQNADDEILIKEIYKERFAPDPTSPTGLKYFRSRMLAERGWDKGLRRRASVEPARALYYYDLEKQGKLPCKKA